MNLDELCSRLGVDPTGPLGPVLQRALDADASSTQPPSWQERLDDLRGKLQADIGVIRQQIAHDLGEGIAREFENQLRASVLNREKDMSAKLANEMTKQATTIKSLTDAVACLTERVRIQSKWIRRGWVLCAVGVLCNVGYFFVFFRGQVTTSQSSAPAKIDYEIVDRKLRGKVLEDGQWRASVGKDVLVAYRHANSDADSKVPVDVGGKGFPSDTFIALRQRFPSANTETMGVPWFSVRSADVVVAFRKVEPAEMQRVLHDYRVIGRPEQ